MASVSTNPGKITVAKRKEDFMKKSPFVEIVAAVTVIITIISMALAISAFDKLKDMSSDVSSILDNWSTRPVTNVVTVPAGSSCPPMYFKTNTNNAYSPESLKGSCACNTNSFFVSTVPNCSDTAEVSGYCRSDTALSRVKLPFWRKRDICLTSGADSSVIWNKHGPPKYERPQPSNGGCKAGYKKCGVGKSYENGRAICVKAVDECPFTSLIIAPSSTVFLPGENYTMLPGAALDGGYVFFGRRGTVAGELPLVKFTAALSETTLSSTYPVASEPEKRGVCYSGTKQSIPKYSWTPKVSSSESWSFDGSSRVFPSSCKTKDKRWKRVDSIDLETFMLSNMELVVNDCITGGLPLYPYSSSSYSAANDPDYYASKVASRSGYSYAVPSTGLSSSCSSTDGICNGVFRQTLCGKYAKLAHQFNGDTSHKYGIFTQEEIYWDPACKSTRWEVNDQHAVLMSTVKAQMAVLIVSIICGIVGGIGVPVYVVAKHRGVVQYTETHDRPEFEEFIAPPLTLFKVIPLIAAMIFVSRIYGLYLVLGHDNCSDETTNKTFTFLAQQLPTIYYSCSANIACDGALLLYGFYVLYHKKSSSDFMFKRTKIDSHNRKLIEFDVPRHHSGARPLKISCFCAIYEFYLPSDLGEGSKIYIYEDGEIWGSLEGREFNEAVGNPQGVVMTNIPPVSVKPSQVVPVNYEPVPTSAPMGVPQPAMQAVYHGQAGPSQVVPQQAVQGYGQPVQGYAQAAPGFPQVVQAYAQPAPGFPQSIPGFSQPIQGYPQQMQGYPQSAPGFPQPVQGYAQPFPQSAQGFVQGNVYSNR